MIDIDIVSIAGTARLAATGMRDNAVIGRVERLAGRAGARSQAEQQLQRAASALATRFTIGSSSIALKRATYCASAASFRIAGAPRIDVAHQPAKILTAAKTDRTDMSGIIGQKKDR